MDQADYSLKVFYKHLDLINIKKEKLYGKTLIEIGPGDSLASALIASSIGAKIILIDVGYFAINDAEFYKKMARELREKGCNVPHISHCKTVADMLVTLNAKYFTDGINSFKKIENESIDIIFSNATLEHVRKRSFLSLIKEMRRVLKTNCYSSHTVDLQDHFNNSLNHLRFSEYVWESKLFSSSGFYTNRMSISEISSCFHNAGFDYNIVNKTEWEKMPLSISKLNAQFRNREKKDLLISSFDIVTVKK